jgi:inorganic pyrophosphatase
MHLPRSYNKDGELNVIIETPKGSHFKSDYDPKFQLFRMVKGLPAGMHFPYDFGFIPGTLGEDGDPLDILVLSPYPLFIGCMATVKLIGVLEAEQTEKESKKVIRNDRLIGCLQTNCGDENSVFSNAKGLPSLLTYEIEAFFIQYNRLEGKQFYPLGWYGPKRAHALVEEGAKKHKR